MLEDETLGDSIDAVEELLHKHEDFEKMVFAQEDRFNAVKRITLVMIHCFIYICSEKKIV